MHALRTIPARYRRAAVAGLSVLALSACGTSSPASAAPASTRSAAGGVGAGGVLPVKTNPISNPATAQTLSITKLVVENNVNASGKVAPDHIEVHLSNTGPTALGGFEVYYTETDTVTNASESYYTRLPASFTIPAGVSRAIHFDNSGAPGHFPVNRFDLYHTSKNALQITVEVSANSAAPVTAAVQKSAGGAETAD